MNAISKARRSPERVVVLLKSTIFDWFYVGRGILTIRCRGCSGGPALRVMALRGIGKMGKTQTTLDSTLENVDTAETLVMREALNAGFDEDEQHQIGMSARECMVNAVVHGNRYSSKKKVHLDIERTEEGLTITIGDEGEGFDLTSLPDPLAPENLLRQSGRGLLLIRAFMDEFDLHPRPGGGTEVRLVKKLTQH